MLIQYVYYCQYIVLYYLLDINCLVLLFCRLRNDDQYFNTEYIDDFSSSIRMLIDVLYHCLFEKNSHRKMTCQILLSCNVNPPWFFLNLNYPYYRKNTNKIPLLSQKDHAPSDDAILFTTQISYSTTTDIDIWYFATWVTRHRDFRHEW